MSEGYGTSDNVATVRRWFDEVWNKGRAEAIDEMFEQPGVLRLEETGAEPPDADDALPSLD